MIRARSALAVVAALPIWLGAGTASAQELGPPSWSLTETSVLNYHFDNRDSSRANDKYGEWLNRLNVQVTSGHFTAAVRIDSALYFHKPDPNVLAAEDAAAPVPAGTSPHDQAFVTNRTISYGHDLSTRYVDTLYPAKLYVTYSRPTLDITVGDSYVQLGRGLVLSMRKVDELGIDTTLRGAKIDYKPDLTKGKLTVTLVAGVANPLRVDDPSGRQLTQRTTGFDSVLYPLMPGPNNTAYVTQAQPTFATDTLIGGQVVGGPKEFQLGIHGVSMVRGDAPFQTGTDSVVARDVGKMQIASVSANIPNIGGHGSFYIEGATQALRDPFVAKPGNAATGAPPLPGADSDLVSRTTGGYALYALLTTFSGPFTLTIEGKHYNRFYPLVPNIDANAAEFRAVQYSVVPTTEPITNDTQFNQYNTCVTGARARLDTRVAESLLVFASVGRYSTWSERSDSCGQAEQLDANGNVTIPGKSAAIRNDIWDPYFGFELQTEGGDTHAYVTVGGRFDNSAEPEQSFGTNQVSNVYYREDYVRYDLLKHISKRLSIETAGVHRYRHETAVSPIPWREGENYLSVLFASKITAAFGYEYTTLSGTRVDYYNGQVLYRFTPSTSIRGFVGQQREALRCIAGVCRVFPAFDGAKLELVMRL